jgi:hypothetical protein
MGRRFAHPEIQSAMLNAGIQILAAGLFSLVVGWFSGETMTFSFAAVGTESWLGGTGGDSRRGAD